VKIPEAGKEEKAVPVSDVPARVQSALDFYIKTSFTLSIIIELFLYLRHLYRESPDSRSEAVCRHNAIIIKTSSANRDISKCNFA
jgi:hypothetical protein